MFNVPKWRYLANGRLPGKQATKERCRCEKAGPRFSYGTIHNFQKPPFRHLQGGDGLPVGHSGVAVLDRKWEEKDLFEDMDGDVVQESDDGGDNHEVSNDDCEDSVEKTNQLELDQGEERKVRWTLWYSDPVLGQKTSLIYQLQFF